DEEEEYPFVKKYPSFQEESIMLVEEQSCPVYDTDNEKDAEPAPKYDSDGHELVYEDEEVCLPVIVSTHMVQKWGMKEEDHLKPYQLTLLKKWNAIKVSRDV
nr:hypothetical protein [Tanacetum cinerariifolium]